MLLLLYFIFTQHFVNCVPVKYGDQLYNVKVIMTEEESKYEEESQEEEEEELSGGTVTKALGFLHQFGYLPRGMDDAEALYRQEGIEDALRKVQFFGGIPQTGKLDNATRELMTTPRCGVSDIPDPHSRKKRFVIGSEGWNKRKITYFLANWSNKLGGHNETLNAAKRAFRTWSGYAPLVFTPVQDPAADIIIGFTTGAHGDGFPFDGRGFVLAHAFYPHERGSYGGDIHFDDEEPWELDSNHQDEWSTGIDFFTVMVHEIGHSLGLAHSPVPGSIMYPYYKGKQENLQLDYDDVLAMYQLYISRPLEGDAEVVTTLPEIPEPRQPPTDVPLPPPELPPDYYDDYDDDDDNDKEDDFPTFDDKGDEDIFRDWETKNESVTPIPTDFPKLPTPNYEGDSETVEEHESHADFPDPSPPRTTPPSLCEGNFDAISVIRGELFIFKDQFMWRLPKIGTPYPGYPIRFRRFFHQLPDWVQRIDAVYQRPTDGYVVLFTGRWYWVYDGNTFIQTDGHRFVGNSHNDTCEFCRRPLRDLGIPAGLSRVDAALVWKKNGKTYFFSSNLYWRYNDTAKRMDKGYPHDIARWRGVPYNIDAALRYTDGMTYFFKGYDFWRFDDYSVKTDPDYPLPAPQVWVGCSELLADLSVY